MVGCCSVCLYSSLNNIHCFAFIALTLKILILWHRLTVIIVIKWRYGIYVYLQFISCPVIIIVRGITQFENCGQVFYCTEWKQVHCRRCFTVYGCDATLQAFILCCILIIVWLIYWVHHVTAGELLLDVMWVGQHVGSKYNIVIVSFLYDLFLLQCNLSTSSNSWFLVLRKRG